MREPQIVVRFGADGEGVDRQSFQQMEERLGAAAVGGRTRLARRLDYECRLARPEDCGGAMESKLDRHRLGPDPGPFCGLHGRFIGAYVILAVSYGEARPATE